VPERATTTPEFPDELYLPRRRWAAAGGAGPEGRRYIMSMHVWRVVGAAMAAWVVLSLMGCGRAGSAMEAPDGGAVAAGRAALRYDGAISFQRGAR